MFNEQKKMISNKVTIVFCGIGSIGDVLPMVKVASEMTHRGYKCIALSNSNHESLFKASDIGFISTCGALKNNLVGAKELIRKFHIPSISNTMLALEKIYTVNKNIMIVNISSGCASSIFSEYHNLPLVRLYYAPSFIPFGEFRKSGYKQKIKFQLLRFTTFYHSLNRELNEVRCNMGLIKNNPLSTADNVGCRIAFFPEWFLTKEMLFKNKMNFCGFPNSALVTKVQSLDEDSELFDFINRWGKPIVFTPGTATTNNDKFFKMAKEICDSLNMSGIFLSSNINLETYKQDHNILLKKYYDLDVLLPYCSLIIHHGGIGTLSNAIKACVPQIIRPVKFDQPYNGMLISKLGLGVSIPPIIFNVKRVSIIVKKLIQSDVIKNQIKLAHDNLPKDSINDASNHIEDYLNKFIQ